MSNDINDKREKVLFIVNPASGKMMIKNKLFEVLKLFSDAGFEPTVLMTEKTGDATSFAKKYAPDFDRIISCGGDGTLNEIVTGIMSLSPEERPPLGFIPNNSRKILSFFFIKKRIIITRSRTSFIARLAIHTRSRILDRSQKSFLVGLHRYA